MGQNYGSHIIFLLVFICQIFQIWPYPRHNPMVAAWPPNQNIVFFTPLVAWSVQQPKLSNMDHRRQPIREYCAASAPIL